MSKKPTPKSSVAVDAARLETLQSLPMRNSDAECLAPRADLPMKTVDNGQALFWASGCDFLVAVNRGDKPVSITVTHGVRTARAAIKRMPIKDYEVAPGIVSILGPFDPDGFSDASGLVSVVVTGAIALGVIAI